MFSGKRILVTGGTGSFGHYITTKLLSYQPAEILVFSRDEKKQDDMRNEFGDGKNIRFIIGDVRDRNSLRKAVRGIDYVFHAAALKQVPSCEYNVCEAFQTNTLGAQNLIEACLEENVKKVITISTDKAVKPVNVMGMTKALQERLFITANLEKWNKKTVFACARYGNVAGSRGSVVPLFKRQIEKGGPITLTDSRMTRFILTLSEAINLAFLAMHQAVGGEIFVPKIPAVNIIELAEVMIKNLSLNKKINKKLIGIRPGEEIHEVLISEEEALRTVENGDSFIILPSLNMPKISVAYQGRRKAKISEYSSQEAKKHSPEEIELMLKEEGWIR
ncbi:MAG: UDP-N-acetylglucosamine 4,6-dehydratase family protein [Candidatus Edwardsbacteria bacterium]